jgi:hypothetical protein
MKKGYIYLVIGNCAYPKHFCEIGEIVIGTGERGGSSYRYERECFQKMGIGRQYISKNDVFEIGKL